MDPASPFRSFTAADRHEVVARHCRLMCTHQTVAYVHRMHAKFGPLAHATMTMREALAHLRSYVDASDPDIRLPNLARAYQVAAAMRAAGEPEWMQVTGLIHDVGKIMFLWGDATDGQQAGEGAAQWGLSGDTWAVGCALPASVVSGSSHVHNPDASDPRYTSESGVYAPGCGVQSLLFAWGRGEYLYQVLRRHREEMRAAGRAPLLPDAALAAVRLHPACPWHEGGAYAWAEQPGDRELKRTVRRFGQYDLHGETDTGWDERVLWDEFGALLDRYFPAPLAW
jgi:inositol oxygenase